MLVYSKGAAGGASPFGHFAAPPLALPLALALKDRHRALWSRGPRIEGSSPSILVSVVSGLDVWVVVESLCKNFMIL